MEGSGTGVNPDNCINMPPAVLSLETIFVYMLNSYLSAAMKSVSSIRVAVPWGPGFHTHGTAVPMVGQEDHP